MGHVTGRAVSFSGRSTWRQTCSCPAVALDHDGQRVSGVVEPGTEEPGARLVARQRTGNRSYRPDVLGGSGDDSFLRHSPQARYRHARMLESIQHVSPFTRPGAVAFDSCPDVPGRQPATGSAALLVNAQFGAHGVDLGLHGQVLLLLARQVVAREV